MSGSALGDLLQGERGEGIPPPPAGDIQRRFGKAFGVLAKEPTRARRGLDVKPLRGVKATWRLRVGDYRGIYEVEPGKVRFTRFGHRSNVYDV